MSINQFIAIFTIGIFGVNFSTVDAATFTTSGDKILDPCRQPFVIRGVNAGIAFPVDNAAQSLSQIAQTGANAVRLTFRWSINRSTPQLVSNALKKAAENQMVAIPSIWDATGDWKMLPFTVDYWSQPDMVAELRKYEDVVMLNIANEAGGGSVTAEQYKQEYLRAVQHLRNAGLHMPLVIDAANWGRREADILQNARFLIDNDSDHNLIFSWHPWDSEQSRTRYEHAISAAQETGIPFIIGEFASTDVNYKLPIDYQYLMQVASQYNVGWLWWWWWSGSNTFDGHSLTKDGRFGRWANVGEEVVMTSDYGINATSRRSTYLNSKTCIGQENVRENAPPAPSNITAETIQGAGVKLSWQDNSNDEKNFDIEVLDEATQSWRLIKVLAPNTNSVSLGANLAFVYNIEPKLDPSLHYQTGYSFRVGAYKNRDAISYSAPFEITTESDASRCSNGDGLKGEYFYAEHHSQNFDDYAGPSMTRIDKNIDFSWSLGSPDPKYIATDQFQVRWTGYIMPQFTGEYVFYTNSDDFARVWIGNQQIIDNWRAFAGGWAVGKFTMVGGQKYPIRVEYREWDRIAAMRLYWSSAQLERQIVQQCRLFSQESSKRRFIRKGKLIRQ